MNRRHFLSLAGQLALFAWSFKIMARPIIWVKPTDQTVVLHEPNPVLTVADLAITSGALDSGDNLADYAANLRFTVSRNYPVSNASETVGKTYKVSATGLNVGKYDFRYQIGKLTVVAV